MRFLRFGRIAREGSPLCNQLNWILQELICNQLFMLNCFFKYWVCRENDVLFDDIFKNLIEIKFRVDLRFLRFGPIAREGSPLCNQLNWILQELICNQLSMLNCFLNIEFVEKTTLYSMIFFYNWIEIKFRVDLGLILV